MSPQLVAARSTTFACAALTRSAGDDSRVVDTMDNLSGNTEHRLPRGVLHFFTMVSACIALVCGGTTAGVGFTPADCALPPLCGCSAELASVEERRLGAFAFARGVRLAHRLQRVRQRSCSRTFGWLQAHIRHVRRRFRLPRSRQRSMMAFGFAGTSLWRLAFCDTAFCLTPLDSMVLTISKGAEPCLL